MTSRSRHFRVESIDGIVVVHFLDRLIAEPVADPQEVGDQLSKYLADEGCRRLVLDFSNVEFISSLMLGKLINVKRQMDKAKGRIVLCGLSDSLHATFRLSRFDQVFQIVEDEPAALDQLRGT